MQKAGAVLLASVLTLFLLAGCNGAKTYQDGVYRAEFANYDSRGYKDFMEVTVEDAAVTAITYDAVAEDGTLKSQDPKYQKDMEAVQETYPARFSQDLVNQYFEAGDITGVDTIAGATYSSDSFVALYKALEAQMTQGNTDTLVVDNVSEK